MKKKSICSLLLASSLFVCYLFGEEMVVMANDSSDYCQVEAVECENVMLSDENAMEYIVNNEGLPLEIRESINRKVEKMSENGKLDDVTITIELEEMISESADNGINPCSESINYHTYNNMPMKNYKITYTNLSQPEPVVIVEGQGTEEVADTIYNMVLTLVGSKSKTISIYSAATSLLEDFVTKYGNGLVTGSTKDYIWADTEFDLIEQWTYGKVGSSYLLGLFTQKVTIKKVMIKQYYYNSSTHTGQPDFKYINGLNKVFESEDFNDPWPKTYIYAGNPWHEPVTAKWKGKTFYFGVE